jgi:hypothetical protein
MTLSLRKAYDPVLRKASYRSVVHGAAQSRWAQVEHTFGAAVGPQHAVVWELPSSRAFLLRGAWLQVTSLTESGTPSGGQIQVQIERHNATGLYRTLTSGLVIASNFSGGNLLINSKGSPSVWGSKPFNNSVWNAALGYPAFPEVPHAAYNGMIYVTEDAGTNILTTGFYHGFRDGASGDSLIWRLGEGGILSSGLAADTRYYVVNRTDTTFQVSATQNGAPIDIGAGDGQYVEPIDSGSEEGEFGIYSTGTGMYVGGRVRLSLLPGSGVNTWAGTVKARLLFDLFG